MMRRIVLCALALLALGFSSAAAQQVTAEVRTFSGQTVTVSDPTFEIFYTILPSVTAGLGGGGAYAPGTPIAPVPTGPGVAGDLAQPPVTIGVGSVGFQSGTALRAASGTLLPTGPASTQGRRQQDFLTLIRSGVELHVPVSSLTSLTFTRQSVIASPLPPYAAASHFRHAAAAVLIDGSQVQADYVNLGTAILRGTLPQGTIDIPWDDIESVTFRR